MHYESWFQFRSRPFSTAPRLADYFPAEAIESSRKTVTNCIQRGAGPTLIVGSCGVGKTMLCQRLADEFRPRTDVALVSGTGMTTRRAMWQSILFELGLPFRQMEVGELRLSLIDHLSSQGADYPGLVLVIDDAHSVPSRLLEEVRMLSNLVRDGNWRVHLVLAGKQSLEEHLALPRMESFNQRIVARCYLKRFTREETLSYVRHQFERAGVDTPVVLTDEGLDCVYQMSHGVARLINQLCDHALVMAWVDGQRKLDKDSIREAWRDLQQLPLTDSSDTCQPAEESTIVEFGTLDDEPITGEETQFAADMTTESEIQPEVEDASDIVSDPTTEPDTDVVFEVTTETSADSEDEIVSDTAIVRSTQHELESDVLGEPAPADETSQLEDSQPCTHGEAAQPCPASAEVERAPTEVQDPESQLDNIEEQITEVNDGDRPELPQVDRYPVVDFPLPQAASDPFEEFFEEEEIVVHDFGALRAPAVQTHVQVNTEEGKRISELMELPPTLEPSPPEKVTQHTTFGDKTESHENEEEADFLIDDSDDVIIADDSYDPSDDDWSETDDTSNAEDIVTDTCDDALLCLDDETLDELIDDIENTVADEIPDEDDMLLVDVDSELEVVSVDDSTLLDELDAEAWTASLDSSVLYEEVPSENAPHQVVESGMLVVEQPDEGHADVAAQYDLITTEQHVGVQTPCTTDASPSSQHMTSREAGEASQVTVEEMVTGEPWEADAPPEDSQLTEFGQSSLPEAEGLSPEVTIAVAPELEPEVTATAESQPDESMEKKIEGTFDTLFSTVQRLGRS